jgi:hypothetical protein
MLPHPLILRAQKAGPLASNSTGRTARRGGRIVREHPDLTARTAWRRQGIHASDRVEAFRANQLYPHRPAVWIVRHSGSTVDQLVARHADTLPAVVLSRENNNPRAVREIAGDFGVFGDSYTAFQPWPQPELSEDAYTPSGAP